MNIFYVMSKITLKICTIFTVWTLILNFWNLHWLLRSWQTLMNRFYMILKNLISCCLVTTKRTWKLFSFPFMDYFNMFFNMSFLLILLITMWTMESLSFMNWFNVGIKGATFFCFIITLRAGEWSMAWSMNGSYVCFESVSPGCLVITMRTRKFYTFMNCSDVSIQMSSLFGLVIAMWARYSGFRNSVYGIFFFSGFSIRFMNRVDVSI